MGQIEKQLATINVQLKRLLDRQDAGIRHEVAKAEAAAHLLIPLPALDALVRAGVVLCVPMRRSYIPVSEVTRIATPEPEIPLAKRTGRKVAIRPRR